MGHGLDVYLVSICASVEPVRQAVHFSFGIVDQL